MSCGLDREGRAIPHPPPFRPIFEVYPLKEGGHSQISSANHNLNDYSILNVNRVQTIIRSRVDQFLGRNVLKTLIKRRFFGLFLPNPQNPLK